jgi:hypothetical protein
MMALKENKSIEINGVYMCLREENIKPLDCLVHINIMSLVTSIDVTELNKSIGVSNFNLKKILNMN